MRLKNLFIFVLVLLVAFVSLQEVVALQFDCEFRQISTGCSSAPWNNIVFRASSLTNAHGETYSNTNYDYGLCCNFLTSRPVSCTFDGQVSGQTGYGVVDNRTVIFSASTNAHAESPQPPAVAYSTPVCYGNLECIQTSNACPGTYPIDAYSISNYTNAHIGAFGDYPNFNICCRNLAEPCSQLCSDIGSSCTAGQVCQGGSFQCSSDNPTTCCVGGTCCTPIANPCGSRVCGTVSDGCGGVVDCSGGLPDPNSRSCSVTYGTCTVSGGTQTCSASGQWNTCTGTTDPRTANCAGKECGSDLCGGTCLPGCSGGETCDAAGQCIPPSPTCVLNDIKWNVGTADNNTLVSFTLNVSNCDGQTVNFVVKEYDGLGFPDQAVSTNPASVVVSGTGTRNVAGQWTTEWMDDAGGLETNPPEYYVHATYSSQTVKSEDNAANFRLLEVTLPAGGGPTCSDFTQCESATTQADCDFINLNCPAVVEAGVGAGITCGGTCPQGGNSCSCTWDPIGGVCQSGYEPLSCTGGLCGDGYINNALNETCDGDNWGSVITDCTSFDSSYTGGALSCGNDCHFNTTQCTPSNPGPCGNNVVNDGEECDGSDWGAITGCSDIDSFEAGTLSCGNDCKFKTDQCTYIPGSEPPAGSAIGNCIYNSEPESDCDQDPIGFYVASWKGKWKWGTNYSSQAACDATNDLADCYHDITGDGWWHYYPAGSTEYATCTTGGTNTIECPAEIRLPFFGGFSFVMTLFAISMIYLFFEARKRK